MSRSLLERRLTENAERLKALRHDLVVTDEQLAQLTDEAENARLRALVSETPLAEREHREARAHADAMARHRADLLAEIAQLETDQDALLDRLASGLPAAGPA